MILEEFIEKLKNKNGKIEGQRLKEKWFLKNNFKEELEYFKENNILGTKDLYKFLTNESGICECGKEKTFIGFNDGFKKYCEKCSRTKYNHMKNSGSKDLEINDIIDFIKDKNNKYSTTKIKLLSEQTLKKIQERTNYLDNASLSERLYHIENDLFSLPRCKLCGKAHNNFYSSLLGYKDYCKGKCSRIYNSTDRKLAQKKYFYKKYKEKFKSNDEYDIFVFSEDDYLKNKNCVVKFKHKKCNHEYTLDKDYQGHYKCPKCYPIRSKKQYEIYNWLKDKIECKFNDRQFLKPKELDILTDTFAIEYDSLMFHSFGKSSMNMFENTVENKNAHLDKTNSCEDKDIQLFRIFSTEWINNEVIWKSVINSKIGNTERIFARKCQLRELTSKEAKDFCNNNHLQGYINSSIRIGLYYNNELVSLMTFGKSRRSKWKGTNNYELYRFCSKLNTTIIGGASKLIKYFETNYKPKSLISYANRRWSTGNVYEKLGFEFIENTSPNYYYFKGGDDTKLLSREQFQKHKLKDKLDIFDPELTETENMYNNSYRKIYDCGNKIYIKNY